jgi:hypothetical protein
MPLSEFELIERYFGACGAQRADVRLGVGDDAALLSSPAGSELVVAADTLVAGVHFPLGSLPASIGHRALAVNLSDLAAMGARPAWALLALTLPRADEVWLEGFAAGLGNLAREHEVALVGGDTTRGPLGVTVQLLGHAPVGSASRRAGVVLETRCLPPGPWETPPRGWRSSRGVSVGLNSSAATCATAFCGRHRVSRLVSGCAPMSAPASMCRTVCWAMSVSSPTPAVREPTFFSMTCRYPRPCASC